MSLPRPHETSGQMGIDPSPKKRRRNKRNHSDESDTTPTTKKHKRVMHSDNIRTPASSPVAESSDLLLDSSGARERKMSALHVVKSENSDAPESYVMSRNFRWFVTTPTIVKSRVKRKAKKTFSTYFTCLEDGIRQLRTGEGLYVVEEPVSLSNESGSSE